MIFNFRNKTILGYPKNETQNQQLGANKVIIKENYHEIYTKNLKLISKPVGTLGNMVAREINKTYIYISLVAVRT